MTTISGGCACGAVKYAFGDEPLGGIHCQCRQCQRATGAGHASLMIVKADGVSLSGALKFYDQAADDGNTVSRGFCPNCGSPVLGKLTAHPGVLLLHAASLDDPALFQPEKVLWRASAAPWDFTDPDLPTFSDGG